VGSSRSDNNDDGCVNSFLIELVMLGMILVLFIIAIDVFGWTPPDMTR
jgi:hypothetical protein